jgi:uncharacterized protein YdeI (YjbR/CyaY-like superfamily)
MPATDPRVDAYIAQAAPFAQPILSHLREVVHEAVPTVEETMKWSRPHFLHAGGILGGISAFKQHCAFALWNGSAVVDDTDRRPEAAMGQFGRITSLDDLPPRATLVEYVRRAAALRAAGVKRPAPTRGAKPPLEVPEAMTRALAGHEAARATFEGFPPSHRREYVAWIAEAKTDATRDRRIAQMLEWLAEGKPRNWKYQQRG